MLKLRFEILELRNRVTNQFIPIMSTILLLTEEALFLGISKISFTSKYLQEFKVAHQERQLERLYLTTRSLLQVAGIHVSKFLNLYFSGTSRDVAPKQRYDRLSFTGDHIHATPTFGLGWTAPGHTVIGFSQKPKELYQLLRVYRHSKCNI